MGSGLGKGFALPVWGGGAVCSCVPAGLGGPPCVGALLAARAACPSDARLREEPSTGSCHPSLLFLEAGSHMPKLAKCPQVTASSHALSCSPTPAALPHLQQVARAGWDPVPHTQRVLCHCSQVPHRLGTPHLVQPHAQRVPPACPSPRTSPLCPAQPDLLLCAVPVPSRCAPAAGAACSQRPLNTRYQAPARQSYF